MIDVAASTFAEFAEAPCLAPHERYWEGREWDIYYVDLFGHNHRRIILTFILFSQQ